MKRYGVLDVIFWLILLAIVFSLVRPKSKGAQALITITDGLAAVIGTATGYVERGSQ
jgi:dolichol kinase